MNAEQARAFLLTLPHVVETMQWGENLVFWVGDKAARGKMFALLDLGVGAARRGGRIISFATSPERNAELREIEGLFPAPYLARAGWIAAERWDALRAREWEGVFAEAHAAVWAKLPRRTRDLLALPPAARRQPVAGLKRAAKRVK